MTDKKDIWGKYAFPGDRKSLSDPIEPHTANEKKSLADIIAHFQDSKGLSKQTANTLLKLKKQGQYTDIVKTPQGSEIYRGMGFEIEGYKHFMSDDEFFDFANSDEYNFEINKNYIFKPHANSSSWSLDYKVAEEFAFSNSRGLGIILIARIMDNANSLFAGKGGFYDIQDIYDVEHEDEVVAIGPIKVHVIEVIKDDFFENAFEELRNKYFEDAE